jgi:hypothetical protein
MRRVYASLAVLLVATLLAGVAAAAGPEILPTVAGHEGGSAISGDSKALLWNQPANYDHAVISQYFPEMGRGVYSADDFNNPDPWDVVSIFVEGIAAEDGLPEADYLHWFIYPDDSGVPAGFPWDGSGTEYWSFSADPSAAGVSATADLVTLHLPTATGGHLNLLPGHWWLVFVPELDSDLYNQWWWYTADPPNHNDASAIDPTDYMTWGWTSWTPWTNHNPDYYSLAFRLNGRVSPLTEMFVQRIMMRYVDLGGMYRMTALVRIMDEYKMPVDGATVSVVWTRPDGSEWQQQVGTNPAGMARLGTQSTLTGTYEVCVTDVDKGGFVYDPSQNRMTCDTIDVP